MLRTLFVPAALTLALACSPRPPSPQGPVVAEGHGLAISSSYLQSRLAAQPPPVRQILQHTERKKKFLSDLIRFELLAQLAESEGLANDPEVQFELKKAMITRYHERFLARPPSHPVAEADIQRYYDSNQDQYGRPVYVHSALLFLAAAEGSPERAAKAAAAQKILGQLRGDKRPAQFEELARERSDDPATKHLGGDLGLRTRQELERLYGPEVAKAALALGPGELASVETPGGLFLLRVLDRQEAQVRRLDDVRPQIAALLAEAQRDAEYEALVKTLQEAAQIRVSEAELARVAIEPAPGG